MRINVTTTYRGGGWWEINGKRVRGTNRAIARVVSEARKELRRWAEESRANGDLLRLTTPRAPTIDPALASLDPTDTQPTRSMLTRAQVDVDEGNVRLIDGAEVFRVEGNTGTWVVVVPGGDLPPVCNCTSGRMYPGRWCRHRVAAYLDRVQRIEEVGGGMVEREVG